MEIYFGVESEIKKIYIWFAKTEFDTSMWHWSEDDLVGSRLLFQHGQTDFCFGCDSHGADDHLLCLVFNQGH